MQSKQDAERIKALGATDDKVTVKGNCKFDEPIPIPTEEEKLEIRQKFAFPINVPVFVAGSTNPGEDKPVIDAFVLARKRHSDLRLILAPRQIERAVEIASMATAAGLIVGRRSQADSLTGKEDVVLLDTFGELATVYSISEAAFVGGTLIKKGGHNILQPIAHGKPVYVGPYTFKCRDLVRAAMGAGVAFEVADGQELGEEIARALDDPKWLSDIEQKAQVLMSENRGASSRCAQVIVDLALGNA
jgi:3-deoxy-D-manno-octulosonic-acid transferase